MPQKVLTRRQRKAAEAMRQAAEQEIKNPQPVAAVKAVKKVQSKPAEKQQQIIPGGSPPAATPLPTPKPSIRKIAPTKKTVKLTQKRTQSTKLVESIIYSKTPVPSGRPPQKKPETLNFDSQPPSRAKPRTTGCASTPSLDPEGETRSNVQPSFNQQTAKEQFLSIWNKIKTQMVTKNSRKTMNIPLLIKICEQFKSRWHGTLPDECRLSRSGEIYRRCQRERSPSLSSLHLTPSEMELIPPTLEVIENYLASIKNENDLEKAANSYPEVDPTKIANQFQSELPAGSVKKPEKAKTSVSIRPDDSIKIIGATGYFVVSGTDEKLAQKFMELNQQGVTVEQALLLPRDSDKKVLQQLEDLLLNREKIIEKMHSKQEMLAGDVSRVKKIIAARKH